MTADAPATEAGVAARVRAHQAAGRRVVFTNGAFDLLHPGHVSLLEAAAAEGDVLVVGVNADATVRRAKGRGRPVLPAADRARVVGALRCVDLVLVFDDETVDRLLEVLRPDVHAKGTDYDAATLPERGTNERLGTRMRFVGPPKQHASSSVVARAAAAGAPPADRVVALGDPDHEGFVNRRVRARLAAGGWLALDRLLATEDGEVVASGGGRTVRRLEMAGVPVLLETTRRPGRSSPIVHLQNHLAVRAVGLRAPEPWLAVEGRGEGGAFVVREPAGTPLTRWIDERWAALGPGERLRAAAGLGRTVRAFHTARFLPADLDAAQWVVDGAPADGAPAFTFLGLRRLRRPAGRITPRSGSPGLAALAGSLTACGVGEHALLAGLRAYLGGSLRASKAWLRAVARRRGPGG